MFLTKKHLSRRAVLRGAGVSLALPFLDAMVPASTALAQTSGRRENSYRFLLYSPWRDYAQYRPWSRTR